MDTVVWPYIRVGADVLSQHAGLLAADAALLADVFPPSAAAHIHILLIRFVPVFAESPLGKRSNNKTLGWSQTESHPPSNILTRRGSAEGTTSLSESLLS